MNALLAACKPLILLDLHRSFNGTPISKEKHLLWVSGWRHSKRLKEALIQRVLQNNGEYEKVRLWKYLAERVLTHRGQSEVSQPRPDVPFTKRLTAAISKALDAIKAQFMSR